MDNQHIWQKYPTLTTSLMLTATLILTSSCSDRTDRFLGLQSYNRQRTTVTNRPQSQVVQAGGNCRQVNARSGLYVWDRATVDSNVVGFLDYGQNITIQNQQVNGLIPVVSPVRGYILPNYVAPCG